MSMDRDRIVNLEDQKRKIIEFIEINGPTIPVKVSSFLKLDTMLASAFLADLLEDGRLRLSFLRVGNSPVYYIRGQEFQLEKYALYLSGKEKEAFELLNEKRVLSDVHTLPAIRVALRSIKDFAFPIKYKDNLYWRFLKVSDQQAIDLIDEGLEGLKPVVRAESVAQIIAKEPLVQKGISIGYEKESVIKPIGFEIEKKQTEFVQPKPQIKVEKKIGERIKVKEVEKDKFAEEPLIEIKKQIKQIKIREKSDFVLDIEDFLEKSEFILDQEIEFKKNDYIATVKLDSQLGKMNMLCIAKNKKSITESDLSMAFQKSTEYKMPVLLIAPGELSKKAVEKLQELKNLVFFKRLD